jgi:unsaturated rhamnogalacturonyl hydrolase
MVRIAFAVIAIMFALPLSAADSLAIGLAENGTVISASVIPGASASAPTVMLIGGMNGDEPSIELVRGEAAQYEALPPRQRKLRLISVANANPAATSLAFPPTGVAYREQATANALWRWIAIHAPDVVLIAGEQDFGLAGALRSHVVAEMDSIPARRGFMAGDLAKLTASRPEPSAAHFELDRRLARSPRDFAEELGRIYGRSFEQPWYIDAMALIAQLRLGQVSEVKRLAEPYVDGSKDSLARPNSLVLAGHLVFGELARRTEDPRYVALVRKVADLGFAADGSPKEAMPYHDEYSDSLFMGTAILAQAGSLTKEQKYFDMAARHITFMQKLVLRPDGLYRHSPLTDAAWGRGNAFPALGLALTLSEFPKDHPEQARILRSFQNHMAVLSIHQDADGLWRNVIDHPGAYPEISATAMIGFSMLRGVRRGWLPAGTYRPRIDAAWRAVLARSGAKGSFLDACESTTKMKSLEEYLQRAALLGPDARTGGMVMLFATEMAGLR